MGNWFARFLKANGYKVIITDKNKRTARVLSKKYGFRCLSDQSEAVSRSDIVILATPTRMTRMILYQAAQFLKPSAVLIEISSIKRPVLGIIRKLQKNGNAVMSIHPMFGPGTKTLKGRRILIVTPPPNRHARKLLSTFRTNGATITRCTPKKHDVLISTILALPHFINISLVETLKSLNADLNELNSAAGTTFQLQLLLGEEIYNEDYDNEISILQNCNRDVMETYDRKTSEIIRMMNANPSALKRMLKGGRKFLKTDRQFASSYARFNAAVQASLP